MNMSVEVVESTVDVTVGNTSTTVNVDNNEVVVEMGVSNNILSDAINAAIESLEGVNVKTVGDGGNFSDIDTALAWLVLQTPETLPGGESGTVIIQAGTANFVGIATNFDILKTGDFIRVTDDTAGSYYPIMGVPDSESVAWSVCGFTSGVTFKTWTIHRPNYYSLMLLPGTHTLTGNYTIPEGMGVNVRGSGRGSTVLNIEPGNPNTIPIQYPQRGHIAIEGLQLNIIDESGPAYPAMGTMEAVKPTTFTILRFNDLILDGKKGVTVLNSWSSGIIINNVTSKRVKYRIGGDLMYFNQFHADRHESTDLVLLNSTSSRVATDVTKEVVIVDSSFIDSRLGAGSVLENNGDFADSKTFKFINVLFDSKNAIAGTENLRLSGGTTYLSNCDFDSANNYDISNSGGNGPVYMSGCKNKSGRNVRVHDAMDVTAFYQTLPAPGTHTLTVTTGQITPNANLSITQDTDILTTGLTINAPVNPQEGQSLKLVFVQDGIGSHVLTFNAVFKIHTNPTGGANQIAMYDFEYNDGSWLQKNQPVWV